MPPKNRRRRRNGAKGGQKRQNKVVAASVASSAAASADSSAVVVANLADGSALQDMDSAAGPIVVVDGSGAGLPAESPVASIAALVAQAQQQEMLRVTQPDRDELRQALATIEGKLDVASSPETTKAGIRDIHEAVVGLVNDVMRELQRLTAEGKTSIICWFDPEIPQVITKIVNHGAKSLMYMGSVQPRQRAQWRQYIDNWTRIADAMLDILLFFPGSCWSVFHTLGTLYSEFSYRKKAKDNYIKAYKTVYLSTVPGLAPEMTVNSYAHYLRIQWRELKEEYPQIDLLNEGTLTSKQLGFSRTQRAVQAMREIADELVSVLHNINCFLEPNSEMSTTKEEYFPVIRDLLEIIITVFKIQKRCGDFKGQALSARHEFLDYASIYAQSIVTALETIQMYDIDNVGTDDRKPSFSVNEMHTLYLGMPDEVAASLERVSEQEQQEAITSAAAQARQETAFEQQQAVADAYLREVEAAHQKKLAARRKAIAAKKAATSTAASDADVTTETAKSAEGSSKAEDKSPAITVDKSEERQRYDIATQVVLLQWDKMKLADLRRRVEGYDDTIAKAEASGNNTVIALACLGAADCYALRADKFAANRDYGQVFEALEKVKSRIEKARALKLDDPEINAALEFTLSAVGPVWAKTKRQLDLTIARGEQRRSFMQQCYQEQGKVWERGLSGSEKSPQALALERLQDVCQQLEALVVSICEPERQADIPVASGSAAGLTLGDVITAAVEKESAVSSAGNSAGAPQTIPTATT